MRIRAAASMFAILVIAGQTAIGNSPNTAAADGFGGPCTSVGPGAILPPPVYFTTAAGAPYAPRGVEFTDTETLPLRDFSATAHWGDGTITAAIVGKSSSGCFEATAPSHTYANPGAYQTSNDTVSVLVWAGDLMGKWATSSVSVNVATPTPDTGLGEKPQFKFVGQPIAAAIPSVKGKTSYEIIFRLNRQLPQTKSGQIQAQLIPYGEGNSIASFGPHETHTCYAAGSDGLARQHPKAGHRYPFTLAIQRPTATKAKGHAILHRYFNFVSMLSGASKRLGC
jgi:hypothetical protein